MMREVTLIRYDETDEGTFGMLIVPGHSFPTPAGRRNWLETIELPWRDNQSNISSIPPGRGILQPDTYKVQMRQSPRHGWTYWITGTPGRSWILIHPANLGGDVSKGFKTHLAGCIGPGLLRGVIKGQRGVIHSRTAVDLFVSAMNREPFLLTIKTLWSHHAD